MNQKPFFSIGIIFRNEIRCLERCLKSLQPLRDAVPCEVVMADTGSDDGSREIAARYADILFDFPWTDDFSAARNAVMDRCSGQWYFSIDADEWLAEDISELVVFSKVKAFPQDFGAVNIHNYNTVELDETREYNDFVGIRLLRMSTGIRYKGCIHERWFSKDGGPTKAMRLGNTWLKHDGYAYENEAAKKAKYDRNMALLKKKLAEDPEDLQTLVECIDLTRDTAEGVEYARRLMEVAVKKPDSWEHFGPVVYRGAVSAGKLQKMPELRDWIRQAEEEFPNSIFTRVDTAYFALTDHFDTDDYAEAIRWGRIYLNGLADYRAGKYEYDELLRGGVDFASPLWERRAYILLGHAYLELGEYGESFHALQSVKGDEIEETRQVESVVNIMMRLHREAEEDTPALAAAFWEQINRPLPDEERAKKRRGTFLQTAGTALSAKYRRDELGREEFLRHSYTMFASLEGKCALGTAAAMLETTDPALLEQRLARLESWDELPIHALIHAVKCGMRFPLPGKPLHIEEMDTFIGRMAQHTDGLQLLTERSVKEEIPDDIQQLAWMRGMVFAAVRKFDWNSEDADIEQGAALVRAFAEVEKRFLPLCYAPGAMREENLFLLPAMHRFGFYCVHAFDALKRGDTVEYVRLLRAGLAACETARDVVEFLLKRVEEMDRATRIADAPPELIELAKQVKLMLARFAPDDPAVVELKKSPVYQQVAWLIEKPASMAGTILQ